jgi:hypothetical protein
MMYMITHGRIVLSYLKAVITNGFLSLIKQDKKSERLGIGEGLVILGFVALLLTIV